MKFLEPVRKIHEEVLLKGTKPILLRSLSVMALACAFVLYGTDNMVWFANMGIIEPGSRLSGIGGRTLPRIEWFTLKNIVALAKNVIEIAKYFFDALKNYKRQFQIMEQLGAMEDQLVRKGSPTYELLKELIQLRSRVRFTHMGTVQNLLRIIMVSFRLRFPLA